MNARPGFLRHHFRHHLRPLVRRGFRHRVRWLRPFALSMVFGTLLAVTAWACIPANSRLEEAVMLVCPGGDAAFHVRALDAGNIVVPGSMIQIEWHDAGGFKLAAPKDSDPYRTLGSTIFVITDGQGRAAFPVRAGGFAPGSSARLMADGVLIAPRTTASPDQNGDLQVNVADVSLMVKRMLSPSFEEAADLDGDDKVNARDLGIILKHLGHRS